MRLDQTERRWRVIDALILAAILTIAKLTLDAIAPRWWVDLGNQGLGSHVGRTAIAGLIGVPFYVVIVGIRRLIDGRR